MGQLAAGVLQRGQTELADVVDPLAGAGEVLVVAGDEVRAEARAEQAQRFGGGAEVVDAAVDEVADDGDEVGLRAVDRVDDALGVGPAEDRSEVDVADDGDPEPVRRAGQPGERDLDALDARAAEHAVGARPDGRERGRGGRSPGHPRHEHPPADRHPADTRDLRLPDGRRIPRRPDTTRTRGLRGLGGRRVPQGLDATRTRGLRNVGRDGGRAPRAPGSTRTRGLRGLDPDGRRAPGVPAPCASAGRGACAPAAVAPCTVPAPPAPAGCGSRTPPAAAGGETAAPVAVVPARFGQSSDVVAGPPGVSGAPGPGVAGAVPVRARRRSHRRRAGSATSIARVRYSSTASHMYPGHATTCWSQNGAPARPAVRAASASTGSAKASTVPVRRAAPPARVVSRTSRTHSHRCTSASRASTATTATITTTTVIVIPAAGPARHATRSHQRPSPGERT